jgi:GH15 family glucan-1,4-alpha-glucosidase
MTDPAAITLDHGVIGNGRLLALVAPSTHIDWLCMPRFDSPSVFGRILDIEKGGTFALLPACAQVETRMEYVKNTNVLRTEVICVLPTLGLIDPKDPRFVSTVDAYERLLVDDGLMLRYRHQDDFGETTSAFSICSFWWAEALAMIGRLDDAIELFHRLLNYANPVGLFSEDIEPRSGRLLGNFPQAYTHVGLINTAVTLGELIEARDARFRAWS